MYRKGPGPYNLFSLDEGGTVLIGVMNETLWNDYERQS